MRTYKLKQLPIGGGANYADIGQLQRRIEHIETILNLLGVAFTEGDDTIKLSPEAAKLFDEVKPETII